MRPPRATSAAWAAIAPALLAAGLLGGRPAAPYQFPGARPGQVVHVALNDSHLIDAGHWHYALLRPQILGITADAIIVDAFQLHVLRPDGSRATLKLEQLDRLQVQLLEAARDRLARAHFQPQSLAAGAQHRFVSASYDFDGSAGRLGARSEHFNQARELQLDEPAANQSAAAAHSLYGLPARLMAYDSSGQLLSLSAAGANLRCKRLWLIGELAVLLDYNPVELRVLPATSLEDADLLAKLRLRCRPAERPLGWPLSRAAGALSASHRLLARLSAHLLGRT